MRVLVAYASKRGGTRGIAEMLGAALTERGLDADVRSVGDVHDLTPYGAVVVGGALYMNRWHRGATHFVRKHAPALKAMPFWAFSSGPLDDSAAKADLPPVPQVQKLLDKVDVRGHLTFGGRLEPDAKGFVARNMAREHAGDWRDAAHIRRWAGEIASALVGVRSDAQSAHP